MRAQAPSNSISLDALERLPSLSLRRWMWKRLRVPSGSTRGSRKQDRPPSAWASTRNASHIGAEQNHLCPVSSYSAPGAAAVQRARDGGVGAHVGAALLLGHRHAAERAGLVGAPARAAGRTWSRSGAAPTPPRAPASCAAPGRRSRSSRSGSRGRPRPGPAAMNIAARATCAPGPRLGPGQRVQRRARPRSPAARARRGGTRPRRCGCRSGRACAGRAGSRSPGGPSSIASPPANSPTATRAVAAQPPPSRSSASTSGRSCSKTL